MVSEELPRRDLLRVSAGALVGLAGCALGRHHRPELLVDNWSESDHHLSVVIERLDGHTLFDNRILVPPDESREYPTVLPRPSNVADDQEFRARASLDTGGSRSRTFFMGSGFHQLAIYIESEESIRVGSIVH